MTDNIEKLENADNIEVKNAQKDTVKFKPGAGCDIGTSNIVVARQTEDGTFVNRYHRNMLYPLAVSDESADLLERSSYLFVKVQDKYYIVGEDALRLVNAIGKDKDEIIRPMKDGILNPNLKESSELLFYIINAVVGDPIIEGETLRFSLPANPIDRDMDNVFHKMVLNNFFTKMGYTAKAVNEAMAICYDCNPVMKSDDGEAPLSGVCVSCGGGMVNVALMYKGLEINSFSITKSGDDIDEKAARVTGLSKNKIIKIKEKELDLNNVDMSDRVKAAIAIYYDEMIDRVIHLMAQSFVDKSSDMDGEIEVVVAGGTSMAPGFCKRFEDAIKKSDMPFKIYQVRHSETPFYSVSQGACIRAQADYTKSQKK
jgi:actin-like ATPase involved in cell morphogenesis